MNRRIECILLANHHLDKTGGTETYTYAIAEELIRRGITVEYFTFRRGEMSSRMERDLNISFMTRNRYPLILANHNTCVNYLFNKGFTIQTCHGVFPELEQPSPNADAYVAISEEVKNHLGRSGYNSKIILNGINLHRFTTIKPLREKLQHVLSLCHSEAAHQLLSEACADVGATLSILDKYNNPVWDVEQKINKADLVVGVGRSAYEAMACGRPVIIFDHREYYPSCGDGYGKDLLQESIRFNCSGRYSNKSFMVPDMISELKKYKKEDGIYFRMFVEQKLDIRNSVDAYLNYFAEVGRQVSPFTISGISRRWRQRKLRGELLKHFG